MPSAGYAALQVIPSMRGIDGMIRASLVQPLGRGGEEAGQAAGEGVRKKLTAGLAVAGLAAGGLIAGGIVKAMEQASISSTLQAQLGTSNKVAAKHGKLAGKLYSTGVSGSFQEAADAIKSTVQAGLAPPGTTNKQLQSIATKASDVANVFGQDLGGVTNAVSQLMRTGLAKNSGQAFDLITRGFQTGTDKGGDFLDTINEYGVQFKKAGLDGATSIGLLNQAIKAGARDSDVAADAIKEFSIRAVDGSTLSAQGFQALGLNADTMAAKFSRGGKSATGALDITLDRLRNMKDPVKQSAAATALFGTQAEDLGQALFAMDPSSAAKGLGKVGGAAGKMGKVIRSGPSHEIEVFKRTLEQGFVQFLGGRVLPVVTEFATWFNRHLLPPISAVAKVVAAVLLPALAGLWQALTVLVTAGIAVVGWLRDWGVWLIPIGIAVGGLTLMLSANALATAAVTAAFSVYRTVILIGTAVTNGFAAAQALLGRVMALSPIGLIIIAIVALVAAIVIAYRRSETFRAIVQAAWAGIKTAALVAWNSVLKPVFAALKAAFVAVANAAVWLWRTILTPVINGIMTLFRLWWTGVKLYFGFVRAAIRVVAAVFTWIWRNIISPWVNGILTLIKLWWRGVQLYFRLVRAAIRVVAAVFTWIWRKIVGPWVRGIIGLIKLWWKGVQLYFKLVRAALRLVASVFMWLWRKIVAPVFRGIVNLAKLWWRGVRTYFNLLKAGIRGVATVFRWLRDKIVRPVWNGIKNTIRAVWQSGIRPAFNALRSAIGRVANAFRNAKDAIGKAWNKIKAATKKPINFVIGTVWNNGIKKIWDKILGWIPDVGLPKLGRLPLLASGGTVPSKPGMFNQPTAIVGEGNPAHPEYVIPTDPKYRSRALRLWEQAGGRLMADGGVLGDIGGFLGGAAKNVGGKVWGGIKGAADFLRNPVGNLGKLLNPLLKPLNRIDDTGFGAMVAALPKMVIKGLQGVVAGAGGGERVAGALRWARTQHGKRYQWGGNGNPSWDCSGFLSAIESVIRGQKPHRRWSTHAFAGGSAPPGWKRNLRAPFRIGITHAGVGHTAGTLGGVNVESSGGAGVRVGPQARGASHGMFTSRYGFAPSIGGGSIKGVEGAKSAARETLGRFGWGPGQWPPLNRLVQHESGWRWNARNPSSGAYGLFQALPPTKMRSAGADWRTNPATQIRWGMRYIKGRYGSPSGAWNFWQRNRWYDDGGQLPPGLSAAFNGTHRPEAVLTDRQWQGVYAAARGGDMPSVHYEINARTADFTVRDLQRVQRVQEARARIGRPR